MQQAWDWKLVHILIHIYTSTVLRLPTSAKSAEHPLLPCTAASNPSSTIDGLLIAHILKLFSNLTFFKLVSNFS